MIDPHTYPLEDLSPVQKAFLCTLDELQTLSEFGFLTPIPESENPLTNSGRVIVNRLLESGYTIPPGLVDRVISLLASGTSPCGE